jgi:uncharacterized membrane protein
MTEQAHEPTAGDVVAGIATAPDWISPLVGVAFVFLAGCVLVEGFAWEIKKLERAKIQCHMPVFVAHQPGATCEYIWQVHQSDYARACKILGGKR